VLVRVGDHLVRCEEIWPLVRPGLTDADVGLIVRELLMLDGMRAALEASGRWLNHDQFAPEWKAENDRFAGTFIPLDKMIMFRGYSSLDRYREHFRYRQAYYLWRRSTLTDEEVLAHYQGGGRLFYERGAIVVDLAYAPLKGLPFNSESLEARRKELADAITAARTSDDGATPAGKTPAWWQAVAQRFPPQQAREDDAIDAAQPAAFTTPRTSCRSSWGYSLADDTFIRSPGEVFGPFTMVRRHAWAPSRTPAWRLRATSRRQMLQPFEGDNGAGLRGLST
jgi:hypothetical protein